MSRDSEAFETLRESLCQTEEGFVFKKRKSSFKKEENFKLSISVYIIFFVASDLSP